MVDFECHFTDRRPGGSGRPLEVLWCSFRKTEFVPQMTDGLCNGGSIIIDRQRADWSALLGSRVLPGHTHTHTFSLSCVCGSSFLLLCSCWLWQDKGGTGFRSTWFPSSGGCVSSLIFYLFFNVLSNVIFLYFLFIFFHPILYASSENLLLFFQSICIIFF